MFHEYDLYGTICHDYICNLYVVSIMLHLVLIFLHHDRDHISKQYCLLLDQTNFQIDPKSLKFMKNNYGKPEVCF